MLVLVLERLVLGAQVHALAMLRILVWFSVLM
jgi:hypothetical protein